MSYKSNGNSGRSPNFPYFGNKSNNGRRKSLAQRDNFNRSNGSDSNRSNSSSPTEAKAVIVRDLNPLTIAATIKEYFETHYKRPNTKMDKVYLNLNDNEDRTGTATVIFSHYPLTHSELKGPLIGVHSIDGRRVTVEYSFTTNARDFNNNRSDSAQSQRPNEKAHVFAKSLSMGTIIPSKTFINHWTCNDNVHFYLQFTDRKIELLFSHLGIDYKMEFKFKDIDESIIVERDDIQKSTILTIPLRYPATFWKKNCDHETITAISVIVGTKWERVIHIPISQEYNIEDVEKQALTKPLMPIPREDIIDIGNWTVLRLFCQPEPHYAHSFDDKMKQAAEYNLVPRDLSRYKPIMTVKNAADMPKPLGHVERQRLGLPFDSLYLLESVISYHWVNEYELNDTFYNTIKKLEPDLAHTYLQLMSTSKQKIQDPSTWFHRMFKSMNSKIEVQRSIPNHCAMLRKVIITPSHFYISPPNLETTNRVVRHYKHIADRFIRVQFTDEGFNRIGPAYDKMTKEVIYNRIFDVLKRGIQIGARHYEFLAFSSSQLREQGCWFFAPTIELNADKIRSWMGVFSHEKVVAKHAVRMGQCFSSTRPVYTLQKGEVQLIDDVKRDKYTFSDGVGKISPKLAEEVALQMELKGVPSAFQFRLGGAKGVLTVAQELGNGPVKVQLRPSQIKFESEHLTLEVIRTSTYIPGFLNRQAITLLSCRGVKDEVFMELMDNMLHDINTVLKKPEEAVRVLLGNMDEFGTVVSMIPIIQAGFLERRDPWITNVLSLFRINLLKDIKKKAKIIVPKGAYLLGVMDESGTLEEDEVFVQIFDNANIGSSRQIITGDVVVFRNPCFHPGDIQVCKAVDKPNLHHLVDVIVFSSKGFRDIPSKCSGGDLDGDDYTVYWDPKLIPTMKYIPMDYTAAPPKMVDEVSIKHIIRFFVNYINNDNLGQIANAHLATADQSSVGARDGKCLRLAQLHSEAVDFPKSGKPAEMTQDLHVKKFPDFMQKKDKESYESKKVLGLIFRAIDKSDYKEYKTGLEENLEKMRSSLYDPRLRVSGMELYIAEARKKRFTYNQDLVALMNQYGVQTEAEICSGYIIKWLKKGNSKTKYSQHEYTMRSIKAFKDFWRKEFEKEFYDQQKKLDITQKANIEAKAAAWYYVAYHPNERALDITVEGGFLSFPWCVYDIICDIAKRNTHKKLDDPKYTEAIDDTLIEDGAKRLAEIRGDTSLVVELSDDESETNEESDGAYESDDNDVITLNPADIISNRRSSISAATAMGRSNNSGNRANGTTLHPFTPRPLEDHQAVIPVTATADDIARLLLG